MNHNDHYSYGNLSPSWWTPDVCDGERPHIYGHLTAKERRAEEPKWPSHTHPYYAPALIAAMAASVGLTIGGFGPWVTFVADITGAQAHKWGLVPLLLGPLAAMAVIVLLVWPFRTVNPRWAVPLAWGAVITGEICFASTVPVWITIERGPVTTYAGLVIEPRAGWGLWLAFACSATLCLSATFIAEEIARYAGRLERHRRHREAWTNGWRAVALIVTAVVATVVALYAFVNVVIQAPQPLPTPMLPSENIFVA